MVVCRGVLIVSMYRDIVWLAAADTITVSMYRDIWLAAADTITVSMYRDIWQAAADTITVTVTF